MIPRTMPLPLAATDSLSCRRMHQGDLDRVMKTEVEIYPFPWTRTNFSDSIAAGHEGWLVEVAREQAGGQAGGPAGAPPPLVGYAVLMWVLDEVHLLNLSVAANRQGAGLGRWLLEWLCAGCEARGARSMLLEVRPSNPRAVLLYESAGFSRIGERRGYYPAGEGKREDAIVMRRALAGSDEADPVPIPSARSAR